MIPNLLLVIGLLFLIVKPTTYSVYSTTSRYGNNIQGNGNIYSIQKQSALNEGSYVQSQVNNYLKDHQYKNAYQTIESINQAVQAQRSEKNIVNRQQTNSQQQSQTIPLYATNNHEIFNTPQYSNVIAYNPSIGIPSTSISTQSSASNYQSPGFAKSLKRIVECQGIFVASLQACLPAECPPYYTWNYRLYRCEPPPITCKSNSQWNGTACIPHVLISNPIQITTQYILQTNGINCPKSLMKCSKPICPDNFIWLQNCCVPTKAGSICPFNNIFNGYCMPNYIAQITINDLCFKQKQSSFDCAYVSNAYKFTGTLPPNLTPSSNYVQPILQPQQTFSSFSNFYPKQQPKLEQSKNDYTIPGTVFPIVANYLPPSYVPEPAPRYIVH